MKNLILLDNYYSVEELEEAISRWVEYYNFHRYHEGIGNIIPFDRFRGRGHEILRKREVLKTKTMKKRRLRYYKAIKKIRWNS